MTSPTSLDILNFESTKQREAAKIHSVNNTFFQMTFSVEAIAQPETTEKIVSIADNSSV